MAGMNVDCAQCDNRLTYINSFDYRNASGAYRPVFANFGAYPRLITKGRSHLYEPENNPEFSEFIPVGHIVQPSIKTFGYWESTLPLMNEAGLTIGESSCGTKLVGNKDAILDITELLRIAAERCATAVCAVETMGALSEEYGFMAMKNEITPGTEADGKPAFDDAGEAVVFADDNGEAWVFHITGGLEGVSNSTWAAQRVPEGHITVLSNTFTIGDLPSEPNDEFKFNRNIRDTARAAGLWEGSDSDPIHFTKTFGMDIVTFQRHPDELPIPLYTSLRTWRVYDMVAPSLKLPVYVDNGMYPFSVKPDQPVSHRDVFKILSDSYFDTEFDTREGILAGPFGNPYRLEGGHAKGFAQSPRPISIPRTSYSVLGQSFTRSGTDSRSIAWFAVDQPMTGVYVPLLANVKSSKGIDQSYKQGHLLEFDRESAFWAFDFVSNWMNMNWRNMSSEEVMPLQKEWQDRLDAELTPENRNEEWQRSIQGQLVKSWWNLADRLIVKYNDGYYTRVGKDVVDPVIGKSYGLPDWYSIMIGQTADVHPVWVSGLSTRASLNSEKVVDADSLPKHINQIGEEYPIPDSFDFTVKEWLNSITNNSASLSIDQSSHSIVSAVMAALAGVVTGYVLGKRERRVEKCDPLLG
jgi:dipeptidase